MTWESDEFRCFDRDGKAISITEMATLFELPGYRRIAVTQDMKLHGRKVSTIWLGLDHGYGDESPLIFETMVFGDQGVLDMKRTGTEMEAKIAHADMCAKWELEDSMAREIYDELSEGETK